jgi:uncharacterized protein YkwD
MLTTLILAFVIGQAGQAPQAQWYSITNRPGWEGWGVPNGGELIPSKWREASKPETEWVLEKKKIEVEAWTPVKVEAKVSAAPEPAKQPAQQPVQQPAAAAPVVMADPWGFTGWLNATRATYGLPAVGYDPNLSSWAAMNNNRQAEIGMGHHVMGPARRQNSAIGNAATIGAMWMNSGPHRAALLDPTIRAIGIASLGSYWTFNAY